MVYRLTYNVSAKKRGAFEALTFQPVTKVATKNEPCENYCSPHAFLGAVVQRFYNYNSVRLVLNIEIMSKAAQKMPTIIHIVRPSAILKIGFIKMADDSHIKNQILFFS